MFSFNSLTSVTKSNILGNVSLPTYFMYLMNKVFVVYLDKLVVVFIDDFLVYSKNEEEHTLQLHLIL
jgi:hypothetical protein